MYPLPVFLFLSVEDGIFVLWQHLLFPWHLAVPSIDSLCIHAPVSLQSGTNSIHDFVDVS